MSNIKNRYRCVNPTSTLTKGRKYLAVATQINDGWWGTKNVMRIMNDNGNYINIHPSRLIKV